MTKKKLQWHPAFYAGLQIELEEDKDNLIFENEHQLGTKPKAIDVLVIKKEKGIPVKKEIGHLFRRYNIVEYKNPSDYLSIDAYYKGCAYALFYKADTGSQNFIPIEEVTLTFVSNRFPEKLFEHLKTVWGYRIEERYRGIYYVKKEKPLLPTQIIVTSRLEPEENLWLWCLCNKLEGQKNIVRLLEEYKTHKSEGLYVSVMDMIVRANYEELKECKEEDKDMCEALEELMADVIEEREKEAGARGFSRGIEQGITNIVENMLRRGMTDDDIRALTGCEQEMVDKVKKRM